MNIKSLNPQTVSLEYAKGVNEKKEVKSSEAGDRDADGRRESDQRAPKHQLTDEELEFVLEALNSLSGVKDKNLVVSHIENEGHYTFLIKDPYGEILRRLSTNDAWEIYLNHNSEKTTGQLLDKAV
jgi:hypothetical protein